jgi:hypothetical protein
VGLEVQVKAHVVGGLRGGEGGVEHDLLHVLVMVGVSRFVFDIGSRGSLTEG